MNEGENSSREEAVDPRHAAPMRRKLAFAAVLVVLCLLVIEGAAWIADGVWQFRMQLLRGLDSLEQSNAPPAVVADLDWPDGAVLIRNPVDGPPDPRTYRVAGRAIPGGQPTIGRQRFLQPADVPEGKRPIFILGGSAAFGFPYAYPQSLAGILRRKLLPTDYVVYCAAEPSRKSNHVVAVARRIMDHFEPAALIILCGNNEWQNWRLPDYEAIDDANVSTYRTLAHSRAMAALLYLTSNETVDAMGDPGRDNPAHDESPVHPGEGDTPAPATDPRTEWHPHIQFSGIEYALRFPLDDDEPFDGRRYLNQKERFLDAFEQNLRTIVAHAEGNVAPKTSAPTSGRASVPKVGRASVPKVGRASVPKVGRASVPVRPRVFLLTVPFNHKLSPAWNHPQPESFDPATRDEVRAAIRTAARAILADDPAAALPTIERALALDPHPPILHHMRGVCLESAGRFADAEAAYAQCREHMLGHLGSRLSINERIRTVAAETDAELVDVQAIFERHEHEAGRHFNESLIIDDCHPNPQGHARIADALTAALTEPRP